MSHQKNEQFLCDVCPRSFSAKIYFQIHSITHLSEVCFDCDVCETGFSQILTLDDHFKTHYNKRSEETYESYVVDDSLLSVGDTVSQEKLGAGNTENDFVVVYELVVKSNVNQEECTRSDKIENAHTLATEKALECSKVQELNKSDGVKSNCQGDKSNKLVCIVCGEQFLEKITLDKHFETHKSEKEKVFCKHPGNNNNKICEICKERFLDGELFKKHTCCYSDEIVIKSEFDIGDSTFCDSAGFKKDFSETNTENVHVTEGKVLECTVKQETSDNYEGGQNVQIEESFQLFCSVCNAHFSEQSALDKHLEIHCSSEQEVENISSELSYSKNYKVYDMNEKNLFDEGTTSTSSSIETFLCGFCEKEFYSLSFLKSHMQVHDENYKETEKKQEIVCSICNKKFPSKEGLFDHIHSHAAFECFECNKCGLTFSEKKSYMKHCITHDVRTFECVCGEMFFKKCELKIHMLTHRAKKRVKRLAIPTFECEICREQFPKECDLNLHKLAHRDEKIAEKTCGICKKHFNNYRSLKEHFDLSECRKTVKSAREKYFKRKPCARRKVFSCELCGKRFNSEQGLKNHKVTHAGTKSFVCSLCEKRFFFKRNLNDHMVRAHLYKNVLAVRDVGIDFLYKKRTEKL